MRRMILSVGIAAALTFGIAPAIAAPSHTDVRGGAQSDPDDDGRGPDRSNGGPDRVDGNNGCGNDADFEDDNEGRCRGLRKSAADDDGSGTDDGSDTGTDDGSDTGADTGSDGDMDTLTDN